MAEAEKTEEVPLPFHLDQQFVAKPGRAFFFCPDHRSHDSPRHFHSIDELEKAIYKWLATWNGQPSPFVWKASADVILDKVRRCKELFETGD